MSTCALYRILYGEDYIQESLLSVLPHVDHVFIYWADRPWGGPTSATYKGERVEIPWEKGCMFDGWAERVRPLGHEKISLCGYYQKTPLHQFSNMIDRIKYIHPEICTVICMEPDFVFSEGGLETALSCYEEVPSTGQFFSVPQTEVWKNPCWRIPQRHRPGAWIVDTRGMSLCPRTGFSAQPLNETIKALALPEQTMFNMGFAASSKTMWMKHLTAIAFSSTIGDSRPNESWFSDVWSSWAPGMQNLEISLHHEHSIREAERFTPQGMPDYLLNRWSSIHDTVPR